MVDKHIGSARAGGDFWRRLAKADLKRAVECRMMGVALDIMASRICDVAFWRATALFLDNLAAYLDGNAVVFRAATAARMRAGKAVRRDRSP